MTAKRRKDPPLTVGDRVVRNKAVGSAIGSIGQCGTMVGTIIRVTIAAGAGGTHARIRVRWDNGHEGSVADRQLLRAPPGGSSATSSAS